MAGGGGGGGGGYYGDAGGAGSDATRLIGNITVNPGDVLTVYVGGGGGNGTLGGAYNGGNGQGGAGGFGAQIGSGGGVSSGQWYAVSLSYAWSNFMNTYAVWTSPDEVSPVGSWVTSTRTVYFPSSQTYYFEFQADNHLQLFIDGIELGQSDNFQGSSYASYQVSAGYHTLTFTALNDGGPAGFAVVISTGDYEVNGGSIFWDTRLFLNPDNSYRYDFSGGNGGSTVGDGSDIYYPGAGGGGGGTALLLNGNLIAVAGGGGGGGGEGSHGAGGGNGYGPGAVNPDGTGHGQNGQTGNDQAGTPGGGGGSQGGAAGAFIYYDDAPSAGAYAGQSAVFLPGYGNLTYTSGSNNFIVPPGITSIYVNVSGGGGGGGGNDSHGGASGVPGNLVSSNISVNPGDVVTFVVGNGGAGGVSGSHNYDAPGGTSPTGFNGGYGGPSGYSGWSGSGGGGGAASSVYVNGNLVLVAGGGGGGGGGGNYSYGQGQQGFASSGSTDGGNGGDRGGSDGGGPGGGGGGYPGGAAGAVVGGDSGSYSGSNGGNLVPPGGTASVASNGGGAGGGAGGNGSITVEATGWSFSDWAGSGGSSNNPGSNGYVTFTFNRLGAGSIKVNNEWKDVAENWVKVNGEWKVISGAWAKVSGNWKLISSNSTVPAVFDQQYPTTLTATSPGWGSGGGGPNSNPGVQYSVDGTISYPIQTYAPVSRHYIANSTGDSSFSWSRGLAFVSQNSNVSAQQMANWGFDPSDVLSAINIYLNDLTANVDSYLSIGYGILTVGDTSFSQATNITMLSYASDPQADRHYHDLASDANTGSAPWYIPNPGPDQLIYIWIQDGSGSDSRTITMSCLVV